mgnify:CR=1 FL=1
MATTIDSYSESNQDAGVDVWSVNNDPTGQSFTNTTETNLEKEIERLLILYF